MFEIASSFEEARYAQSEVIDDAAQDHVVVPQQYSITSLGADYDFEGIVRRLQRGDIFTPEFQRGYVWTIQIASRFIESLLLGLPVPGVFLARESTSNKLIVIDGQQRLRTLQFFYEGVFHPQPDAKTKRVFRLVKVQPAFEGLTFATLAERDRIKLRDSVIHATIVRQETPKDDDTSVYHIFERLNQGAHRLAPQEMRLAIYHGDLIELVRELNELADWRSIFGPKSPRLKDHELILRFLALYDNLDQYERPMEEFLNRYAKRNQMASPHLIAQSRELFTKSIELLHRSVGPRAFRPERAVNAAVLDSVMVGLAHRVAQPPQIDDEKLRGAYEALLTNQEYLKLVSRATSDENNVKTRISIATQTFARL